MDTKQIIRTYSADTDDTFEPLANLLCEYDAPIGVTRTPDTITVAASAVRELMDYACESDRRGLACDLGFDFEIPFT